MRPSPSCRVARPTPRRTAITLLLGVVLAAACRREHVLARSGDIVVTGAYAHPSAGDAGAAYVRFHNVGSAPDTLIGMGGPEPAMAMLMGTTAGRMEMVPPLVITAGARVLMQPGGLHVMLSGLTGQYKIGDTLRITLMFARAGPIPVAAQVVPFGEMPE